MQAAPVLPKTDLTALAGVWHGREVTPGREGPVSLSISGQTLEFHGHDENDWVKGTFTLQEDTSPRRMIGTITDCPSADYAGKTSSAIYRLEDGTLTITGNAPGVSDFPNAFDAPDARQFVFKHD